MTKNKINQYFLNNLFCAQFVTKKLPFLPILIQNFCLVNALKYQKQYLQYIYSYIRLGHFGGFQTHFLKQL